ncbi:hypothetical protein HZ326_29523 [Fusarium oxysporum f. sp. albedinis]|nr:hypothetical protein HZ326_29523 [Fusarium oxysporum f. sp. albedinis]
MRLSSLLEGDLLIVLLSDIKVNRSYDLSLGLQTLILNLNPEVEGEPSNIQHLQCLCEFSCRPCYCMS